MITAKLIKSLEFDSKEEYFDYVIDSYLNGQFTQVKDLIKKMSKKDRLECMHYVNESFVSDGVKNELMTKYLF